MGFFDSKSEQTTKNDESVFQVDSSGEASRSNAVSIGSNTGKYGDSIVNVLDNGAIDKSFGFASESNNLLFQGFDSLVNGFTQQAKSQNDYTIQALDSGFKAASTTSQTVNEKLIKSVTTGAGFLVAGVALLMFFRK